MLKNSILEGLKNIIIKAFIAYNLPLFQSIEDTILALMLLNEDYIRKNRRQETDDAQEELEKLQELYVIVKKAIFKTEENKMGLNEKMEWLRNQEILEMEV